jgi:hypothetical protein
MKAQETLSVSWAVSKFYFILLLHFILLTVISDSIQVNFNASPPRFARKCDVVFVFCCFVLFLIGTAASLIYYNITNL